MGEKKESKMFHEKNAPTITVPLSIYPSVQIILYIDGNLETHEDDLADEYGDIRIDLADTVGIDHSYVILPQTSEKIKTPLKKRG